MRTMEKEKNSLMRFSVSLQKNLLDNLDARLTNQGYASRSEVIRDLIREKIVQESWEKDDNSEDKVAVFVIVYDHHQRELNQRMIDIQHSADTEILCTTHVHLDHHNCLETIIFRGKSADIHQIALEIAGLKGVKFSKLTQTGHFPKDL
ncbi:nickel-responsive transcriptional regulator NikR [Helicobacter mustelae]|uniref:Putative nickel-responsive regulator n=1 Tax=Helicobacter mustelae (strain ATCC 43772 / CCUG 25715 / CIP 103759 / LMG 18044 / NCTC 12198 / R85-136P) TaxID=679897 RepID=D3UIX2_HELM1|nr:nickel-responsive transcriptional regulator NikR [Helicobacter mustelae]CBG40447.1 nickel responsive regulator [Helicobacter mustelae 12198]SQH71947.1 nickel responsive regulator [Helicobacter mustelae]STP13088.1 nickel responsive regulator [Helicobacter mustelae]